jgi:prepilin-type processing-associated H-X9-DG protein
VYADENQNRVQIASPLETQFAWGGLLFSNQNIGSRLVFLCPDYPPHDFTNWFETFGVWSDPPKSVTSGDLQQNISLAAIQNPVDYHHIADTTSRGRMGFGGVQFHTFRTNAQMEVHARHNGSANVLFLDGHAEGLKKPRLEFFGITALYGKDTIPSYFP